MNLGWVDPVPHLGKHRSHEYCQTLPEQLLYARPQADPRNTPARRTDVSIFYTRDPERKRDLIKAAQQGRKAPAQILGLCLASGLPSCLHLALGKGEGPGLQLWESLAGTRSLRY